MGKEINGYRDIADFRRQVWGILYSGNQTIRERGFKVGDKVEVGASYTEKEGEIVELNDHIPDKAHVKLTHENGGSTYCWIKSEHLLKITDDN